jgi:hypothetical protein
MDLMASNTPYTRGAPTITQEMASLAASLVA